MHMNADVGSTPITLSEIYNQANACQKTIALAQSRFAAIASLLPLEQYTDILITGCGSSHHLAICASFAWSEMLGRPVTAIAASELMHFPEHYLPPHARPLVLAISRSGGTTEVKLAVERLQRQYAARAIAMVGETGGSVASVCDVELAFTECYEHSVVMTQAFTCMLTGFYLLADAIAGGARRAEIATLPSLISAALELSEARLRQIAEDERFTRFIFLGSGAMKGLADECALKVTEMALEAALSYRTLEFRHGPKAALDAGCQVIIFPVKDELAHLRTLLDEIEATGAKALVVTDERASLVATDRDAVLGIKNNLSGIFLTALYAHVGQLMAYWRASLREANPDAPPHLARTVLLNV
ncbi:MAG: SIS domain-containing protein [Acidobacteriota bacterium]